jgi:hypothetical protein
MFWTKFSAIATAMMAAALIAASATVVTASPISYLADDPAPAPPPPGCAPDSTDPACQPPPPTRHCRTLPPVLGVVPYPQC